MRVFPSLLSTAALAVAPACAFEVDHEEAPAHARHQLQLPATFTGRLPCRDCEGIDHHLDLWPDQTYHLRRVWVGGEGDDRRDALGQWYADPARKRIILHGASEMPLQWAVEGPLRLGSLDTAGEPVIAGPGNAALTSDGTLDPTDLEGLFLGGMITCLADATVFEECLTGRRYRVATAGGYPALERACLAEADPPGSPLYVHLEGGLLMRPAMEGPDRRTLVVDRFVTARPGITCERQRANASLRDTYWRLDRLRGEAVQGMPDRREPHMVLRSGDDPRFTATVGCNRMAGRYEHGGLDLSFAAAASTGMTCPPPLDALERRLASVLAATRGYRTSGETLALLDRDGTVIALFTAVYLE